MDMMLKAASKEVMQDKLLELGLLVMMGDEAIVRPHALITGFSEGASEPVVWSTKPEYSTDGEVTKEGVRNTDYHCNVRDHHNHVRNPEPYHEDDNPSGTDWGDVTWIDASKINTPAMQFA